MKTSVKFGLLFALIWIILTMILFFAGVSKESFTIGVLINLFLLLTASAVGLFMVKREKNFEEGFFIEDFKISVQSALIYGITVSAFVFLYHSKIDPSIRQSLIDNQIEAIHKQVPNSERYAELQEGDPTWKNKSYDDYIENMEDQARSMISATSAFVAHLMGLTFFGLFFAFGSTFIIRNIFIRHLRQ